MNVTSEDKRRLNVPIIDIETLNHVIHDNVHLIVINTSNGFTFSDLLMGASSTELTAILFCFTRNVGVSGNQKIRMPANTVNAIENIGVTAQSR